MPPIPTPRRLLVLSPSSHSPALIPPFLHSLTGSPVADPAPATSLAGYTTHPPLRIANRYYSAEIPIWVDEIGTEGTQGESTASVPGSSSSKWKDDFLSQDADVVRDAIGGVVLCVHNPGASSSASLPATETKSATGSDDPAHRSDVLALKTLIRDVGLVKAQIEDERGAMGDVAGLVVLVGKNASTAAPRNDVSDDLDPVPDPVPAEDDPFSPAWWEDQLADLGVLGFEVVAWDPRREAAGRNQFGGLSLRFTWVFGLWADYGRTPGHGAHTRSARDPRLGCSRARRARRARR